MAIPDPTQWLDKHGDYLYGYAMIRLRNPANAEDAVQETLLAALKSHASFAGQSSERTWLVGILKHKLIDHYRKTRREAPAPDADLEAFSGDEYFRDEGEWVDHWKPERAPVEWQATPETDLERGEFWEVFDECLSPLPDRCSQAFTLREIDGLTTDEICEALDITTSNLWVLLHRARLRLRRCIEINWFRREAASK